MPDKGPLPEEWGEGALAEIKELRRSCYQTRNRRNKARSELQALEFKLETLMNELLAKVDILDKLRADE